jgi:enamine deaminase RidA (YjgF/YER057c/UK114 family)
VLVHGCSLVLRRVEGPEARELFFLCQAVDGDAADAYRAILDVLEAEGARGESIVRETLFLRSLADLESVRAARARVLLDTPAICAIQQPPLDERARLAVSVHAILPLPNGPPLRRDAIAHGVCVPIGGQIQLHASGLHGAGANAHERALAMFAAAEGLLQRAGMEFRDVVRTWIHLRDIDRDYAALNRARREFFAARGIDLAPASTGIGAGLAPEAHDLSLGLYALRSANGTRRVETSRMSAPTLNEAPCYGSDFARGVRVVEANKIALHVSGTASIDEAGRTAHPGDVDAQIERMLRNVAALLEGQGATFADVVSAVTYLKRPADAARLERKLRDAGIGGFPNACVAAPICRPDLLCEMEVLAVLPATA